MSGVIETVGAENLEEVLPLIRQYQAFYQVEGICDNRNREFFAQFGADNPAGCQFLLRDEGRVLGFATVYLSYTTTIAAKVGVLNDLFTVAGCRGQGVGRRLLEHSRDYAQAQGAARLQWVTATDNVTAQRLYDSLPVSRRDWVFYTYSTD